MSPRLRGRSRRSAAGLIPALTLALALGLSGCQATAPAPEGVPAAIAVVPGEVSRVSSASESSWSFSVEVADEAAQRAAITRLTGAGFRILGEQDSDGDATYALTSDEESLNVTLVLTEREGTPIVIYNIARV